jgi:uncharacterized membrane protein YgdD (TMEM256/DUF423 family)
MDRRRTTVQLAGVLGALGIAAGAFGAHALAGSLDAPSRAIYETAVRYHLLHALALLVVGCGPESLWRSRWCSGGCSAWLAGIAVFCGTLYSLALGAPRWLGAVTPIGGLSLIAGWLAVALAARDTAWHSEDRGGEARGGS